MKGLDPDVDAQWRRFVLKTDPDADARWRKFLLRFVVLLALLVILYAAALAAFSLMEKPSPAPPTWTPCVSKGYNWTNATCQEIHWNVTRQAVVNATMTVTPGEVDRYDTYTVIVVGPANSSFALDVYGPNSFHVVLGNRTDQYGVWRATPQAWYDFGTYNLELRAGNVTRWATLKVGCDARCQADIINSGNQANQQLLYSLITYYGTWALLAVVAFEVPRGVFFFRDRAKRAKERHVFTDRETLFGLVARLRGFIQPGDQVADPKNVQNPRIAADQERRKVMEQIHEATSRKYLEWNPGHLQNLDEMYHDLHVAWGQQITAMPEAVPWAKPYVPRKSIAPTTMQRVIAAGSQPNPPAINVAPKPNDPLTSFDQGMRTMEPDHVTEQYAQALMQEQRLRPNQQDEPKQDHRLRNARVALLFGSVMGFMAMLVILAYAGVYVDFLRPLWTPWPPDSVKIGAGLAAFLATALYYLAVEVRHHAPR